MHPDFSDHIHGIYSWPRPYNYCTWNSPTDPGSCDDGADDDHGHGTHVAGSVLGDGTSSGGTVMGIAPEADLLSMLSNITEVLVAFQTTIRTSLMLQLKMVVGYTPTLGAVALGRINFLHVTIIACTPPDRCKLTWVQPLTSNL